MTRKTAHIDIRVDPELIGRIDRWRDRHLVRPPRSAALVHMIEDYLATHRDAATGWSESP